MINSNNKRHLIGANQETFSIPDARAWMQSRRRLFETVLFLLASMVALHFRNLDVFDLVPQSMHSLLGYPPAAVYVSIALAVYGFAATTLILTAMAKGKAPEFGWSHLFYRTAFYIFYWFSGSIAENFNAVLTVGCGLYVLEQCHLWFFYFDKNPPTEELSDKR